MFQTSTEEMIDDITIWSSLIVYWTVWTTGIGMGMAGSWLLAGSTATVYIGMHIYEMKCRHHCLLSADSTALPVAIVFFSLTVLVMWMFGYLPIPGQPLFIAWCLFYGVHFLGHISAIAYSASMVTLLKVVFAWKIASERRA
jgi:hypothetical protein